MSAQIMAQYIQAKYAVLSLVVGLKKKFNTQDDINRLNQSSLPPIFSFLQVKSQLLLLVVLLALNGS
jgi:hypothetical protein